MKNNLVKPVVIKEKAGFTLLELLIVMMIMALMTMIAVNAFSLVQKQMKVDFAADSLVSTFKEAQVLVKSGRRADSGTALCYVVRIGSAGQSGLWTGKSSYIAVSGGGASGGVPVVDSCTVLSDGDFLIKDVFNDNVRIKAILQDGNDIGVQNFYFKPPFGQLYLMEGNQLKPLISGKFQYLIGYDQETSYDKRIEFDTATGEIKKI